MKRKLDQALEKWEELEQRIMSVRNINKTKKELIHGLNQESELIRQEVENFREETKETAS